MKKLFQKILQKLLKKAVNKAVSNANEATAPDVEPIALDSEPDVPTIPQDSAIKTKDPLWVIILKILSYIITLILGFVTSSCTGHLF